MGNGANRFSFVEFTPPSKAVVDSLDFQGASKLFVDSDNLTETQIEELKEIWFNYILRIIQYEKELKAKAYQETLEYFQENFGRMQEIIGNPNNAIEANIESAISFEFELVGLDVPIEYSLCVAKKAVERLLNEAPGKAISYGFPFNDLIIEMRAWAKGHGFTFGPYVNGKNPSTFSRFIYCLDKQLPNKFRKKSPTGEFAVAKRIENLLASFKPT